LKVVIIGAGFVGLQVYNLIHRDHQVVVTTRSEQKQTEFIAQGVPAAVFHSQDLNTYFPLLASADCLVVGVAAGMDDYRKTYLDLARRIVDHAPMMPLLQQIVVMSSTSVYAESSGRLIDERGQLESNQENPKILIETENTYLELSQRLRVCIFRFGEIYGLTRSLKHKLSSLQGKEVPGDGSNRSNLIHVDDCARAIQFAISQQLSGLYNLVCDDHFTRRELYQSLAKKYQLAMPHFDPHRKSHHGKSKIVDNRLIKSMGFELKYPHLEL